jgi:hypothetical protein
MDQQPAPGTATKLRGGVVDEGQDDHIVVTRRRPIPATTHFAVLAAFILPITLLPYLVTRRQLLLLRRRVDELGVTTTTLQQDLTTSLSETAIRRDEHRRVRALLHEMKQEVDELWLQAEQRESGRVAADEVVRSDLRKLLDETRHTR